MKYIITGGCGFIGSNAVNRCLGAGHRVVIVDDLSRKGAEKNLAWLKSRGAFELARLDVRDTESTAKLFAQHRDADRILHLAAQVAVTTSVVDPRSDFEINALGTLNVLEGIRLAGIRAPVIYSSTNKVYGEMDDLRITERNGRYAYADTPQGISEDRPLDFHSPYGCSKGSADQYMIDYHRIYGLSTIVFRQSCIYGYRQFGAEDQGWLAWFMIASQLGHPLTIYGDGKQTRDVLFVDDLLDAYEAAFAAGTAGRAYNIGGGPQNVLSLLELVQFIERRSGRRLSCKMAGWRPGDQKSFVGNIERAKIELRWSPKIGTAQGLDQLYDWVSQNLDLFEDMFPAPVTAQHGS
jgi:CDP-paratose 2-epimerase